MRIGRYELFEPFGTGGMASVHFGKLFASAGFQRIVAIKVPHAQFVSDTDFRAMFLDEARIVARIQSPHVVATLDVIEQGKTLYQVMEYANGPPLSDVLKTTRARGEHVPISVALAIMGDALEGLQAAHEVVDDQGAPLNVVHRDVSPQNILVTSDGVAKVIDFGIAAAVGKLHHTRPGDLKGKASYMAPEQVEGRPVDRRADVYAAGIVLYEILTGARPFAGHDFASTALMHVLNPVPSPRDARPEISEELAAIVVRALEKKPQDRFPTTRAMAEAFLVLPTKRAPPREVAEWLEDVSRDFLATRRALVAALPIASDLHGRSEAATGLAPNSATAVVAPRMRLAEPRPRTLLMVLAAIAATVGAGAVFVATRHPLQAASPRTPVAVAPPPLSAPLATSMREPEAAEKTSETVAASALPTARPHGRDAGVTTSASALPPASKAPCCSDDIRIRFSNCLDNCPAGS